MSGLTKQLESGLTPLNKDGDVLPASKGAHLLEPLRVHKPDQRDVWLHAVPAVLSKQLIFQGRPSFILSSNL